MALWGIYILTMLTLPIHEHEISFHLSVSFNLFHHCLSEFPVAYWVFLKQLLWRAWATAISMDTRGGHETLRLLLQPPRTLCASTGHYPRLPSREPAQPTSARIPWSRDNFPGKTHSTPQAVTTSLQPLPLQDRPAFRTPPSLRPEWARAP